MTSPLLPLHHSYGSHDMEGHDSHILSTSADNVIKGTSLSTPTPTPPPPHPLKLLLEGSIRTQSNLAREGPRSERLIATGEAHQSSPSLQNIRFYIITDFSHQNEVTLLGHIDFYLPDSGMQVTIAFNHFGKKL